MENIVEITIPDLEFRIDKKGKGWINIWQGSDLISVKTDHLPHLITTQFSFLSDVQKRELLETLNNLLNKK